MATRDLNKIMLTGHVEAEPAMRFTGDGELFTTFYVSSTRPDVRSTVTNERFRLIAWGEPLAERCGDLSQGAWILVEGRLQTCTADDAHERTRFPFEVRVRKFMLLGPDSAATVMETTSPRPPAPSARAAAPPVAPRPSAPATPGRQLAPPTPSRPSSPAAPIHPVAPTRPRMPTPPSAGVADRRPAPTAATMTGRLPTRDQAVEVVESIDQSI